MSLFSTPKRRRTPAAVLRSLEAKINKKARAQAKRKNKASIRTKIDAARKKLRGY